MNEVSSKHARSKRTHASDQEEVPNPSPAKQIRIDSTIQTSNSEAIKSPNISKNKYLSGQKLNFVNIVIPLTRLKTFACSSCSCIFPSSARLTIHQNFAHGNSEHEPPPSDLHEDVHHQFSFEDTEPFPILHGSTLQDSDSEHLTTGVSCESTAINSTTELNDDFDSSHVEDTQLHHENSEIHHQPEVPVDFDSHVVENVLDLSCERHVQLSSKDDSCQLQPTHSTFIPAGPSEESPGYSGGVVQINSNDTLESDRVIYRFGCSSCSCIFDNLELLDTHVVKHHGKDASPEISVSNPTQDQEVIPIENHKCSICGLVLGSSLHLQVHMNFHITASTNTDLKCPTCSRQFLTVQGLQKHKALHTSTNMPILPASSVTLHSVAPNPAGNIEAPPDFPASSTSQKQPDLPGPKKIGLRDDEIQKCLLCEKSFSGKRARYSLTVHLNRIHLFNCTICKSECGSQEALKIHESSVHNIHPKPILGGLAGETQLRPILPKPMTNSEDAMDRFPYKCQECTCLFKLETELANHVLRFHTTEYRCCGNVFTNKARYELHTSLHKFSNSGTRNFPEVTRTTSTTAKIIPISVLKPIPRVMVVNVGIIADLNVTTVPGPSNSPATSVNTDDPIPIAIKAYNYNCYLCGTEFDRPAEVVEHIRLLHLDFHDRFGNSFITNSGLKTQETVFANPCTIPLKQAEHPILMKLLDTPVPTKDVAHTNTNLNKLSPAESFMSNSEVNNSTKNSSSSEFKCQLCISTFSSMNRLIVHILEIHPNFYTTFLNTQKESSSEAVPCTVTSSLPLSESMLGPAENLDSYVQSTITDLMLRPPENEDSNFHPTELVLEPPENLNVQPTELAIEQPVNKNSEVQPDELLPLPPEHVVSYVQPSALSVEAPPEDEDPSVQPRPIRVEPPPPPESHDSDSCEEILSLPYLSETSDSNMTQSYSSNSTEPENDRGTYEYVIGFEDQSFSFETSFLLNDTVDEDLPATPPPQILPQNTHDKPIISIPDTPYGKFIRIRVLKSDVLMYPDENKFQEEIMQPDVLPPDIDTNVVHLQAEDDSDLNSVYDSNVEDYLKPARSQSVVESFECMICTARFSCEEEFRDHEQQHLKAVLANRKSGSGGFKFKCALCPLAFFREAGLSEHLKIAHFGSGTRFVAEIWNNRFKLISDFQKRITDQKEARQKTVPHIRHVHSASAAGATCSEAKAATNATEEAILWKWKACVWAIPVLVGEREWAVKSGASRKR